MIPVIRLLASWRGVALCLFCAAFPWTAGAQEQVVGSPTVSPVPLKTLYGALILATIGPGPLVPGIGPGPLGPGIGPRPMEPPELIRRHWRQLSAFGYNQFRILGESSCEIGRGEGWLFPSRQFYLHVEMGGPIPQGYALHFELFQDRRPLVEAEVHLRRDHPLYIRGPLVGWGQLIVMLAVR